MTNEQAHMPLRVDPKDCGVGLGENCCAYLVCGPNGFECGRVDAGVKRAVEVRVVTGTFNAKRLPTAAFPECQTQERGAP